jgi:hypothetical protein
MVRPTEWVPIHLSLAEVAERSGHEVLMEVDKNISLIVLDMQGIFDQQLRLCPIHSLNITFVILINYMRLYNIKLF